MSGIAGVGGAEQAMDRRAVFDQAQRLFQADTEESLTAALDLYRSILGWEDADRQYKNCRTRLGQLRWQRESVVQKAQVDRFEARMERRRKAGIALLMAVLLLLAAGTGLVLCRYVRYNKAADLYVSGQYVRAAEAFRAMGDYRDAKGRVYLCAWELYKMRRFEEALPYFAWLDGYLDHGYFLRKCWEKVAVRETFAAGDGHTVTLQPDGTVIAAGENDFGQCDVEDWTDIVSVAAGSRHTLGLRSDGTVLAVGRNDRGQCDVSSWTSIVSLAAGPDHTVGLRSDCTVLAAGCGDEGQLDVSSWTDVVFISAGEGYSRGRQGDGTALACGRIDGQG